MICLELSDIGQNFESIVAEKKAIRINNKQA